jgi:hypothetical protein
MPSNTFMSWSWLASRHGWPAELQSFLGVAAYIADGGDSGRHPDFALVVDWLRYSSALMLNMRVDKTGHDVLTLGVDFDIACRTTISSDPTAGVPLRPLTMRV